MFDGAKLANEFQIRAFFSFLLIGKSLFEIPKYLFDALLLDFPLLEPLLAERDADAESEVVLREGVLLHCGSVEVWNVGVCPLHSHIDFGVHAPSSFKGDGETC